MHYSWFLNNYHILARKFFRRWDCNPYSLFFAIFFYYQDLGGKWGSTITGFEFRVILLKQGTHFGTFTYSWKEKKKKEFLPFPRALVKSGHKNCFSQKWNTACWFDFLRLLLLGHVRLYIIFTWMELTFNK